MAGLPRVLRAADRELLHLHGQPANAVYGFTAMLINVLCDEKPTQVAVAFDRDERTFRHEQSVE